MIGRRSHDDAQSFEAAFTTGAATDGHIADLVRVAEHLCEAAVIEPSPAFRDALRTRLMDEAATVLVPMKTTAAPVRAATSAKPRRRRVASLTAAAVASAGVVGLVASSASAVPGEMLYPVKRTVESVELQLHRDDASRGSFQLARAAERLAEARQLSADGGSVDLIAETLDDFSTAATDGSGNLFAEYGSSGEASAIRKVNDFAATSSLDLTALSEQLPEGVAASFDAAKDTVTDLAAEASSLCSSCDPADVGSLVDAVTDAAKDTPAKSAAGSATTTRKPSTPATTAAPAPSTTDSSTAPAPRSTPAPKAATPPATTAPPSLTDLTDPLLGGLLGDDDQVGLVPGLLNGLLGTGPTPKP